MDTPFDVNETDRLLMTTRSVRKRLDLERPVPPDVIEDCLKVALQAPTAINSQRWRWLVVTDAGKRAEKAGMPYEGRVLDAEGKTVSVVIIDEAKKRKASLITMGTHGRTGLNRIFTGSVAESVVRSAPCSVLTVKPKIT